jgi:electron transport complex protein RnfE
MNKDNPPNYASIAANGLWKNNPALVQLLGLCPLLAVSSSVVNALGLGIATLCVLVLSNLSVSLLRSVIPHTVRLPIFVVIIASSVTAAELLMQAFTFELYQVLGIFLPLITTNCAILARAEAYASRNSVGPAVTDGIMMGLGFAAVLVILGAIRECLATGALFSDMHLLFGEDARAWQWVIVQDYEPFLLAALPPGAFLITGLLIALKNQIDSLTRASAAAPQSRSAAAQKRVRVTGPVK